MNKKILIILFFLLCIIQIVQALNIDSVISISKKSFYPNETIPINISVINRETTFAAKNLSLAVMIGQKTYTFKLDDLLASQSTIKSITLPEQVLGTYIIHSILNYTDYFGEIKTLENYNSFEVKFPEIKRLPRNVYIKSFDLPDNVTAGKTYEISVNVVNDGTVPGDLILNIESLDANTSKSFHLDPNESKTVNLKVKFYNPGISLVEAKVYAVVDDSKYIINYATKNVYVTEEKIAKLKLDRIEIVDDPDNQINQNDKVKLKIYLRNDGNSAASDVKGTLSSSEINVTKPIADYKLLLSKETNAPDYFVIKTVNASVGQYNLSLDVAFNDLSGSQLISFSISIEVKPDLPQTCKIDSDCTKNEVCKIDKCEKLVCDCGEVNNHKCIKYACCSDSDCEEGYVCSSMGHVCEPSKEIKASVLIVTSTKLKSNNEFDETIKEYRKTILNEMLPSFYILIDSQKVKDLFNIQPADPSDWKSVKNVLDKIIYKIKPDYVLILGGTEVIPQPPAKTEANIPTVPPSDDTYSDLTLDGIPDIAIGRIPIDDIKVMNDYLRMLIQMHKETTTIHKKIILGDACGGNDCFLYKDIDYTSDFIFGMKCEQNNNCLKSPPYCSDRGSPPIFPVPCEKKNEMLSTVQGSDFIFIGAHGDGTGFYSIEETGGGLLGDIILSSGQIYEMDFSKKIIMTFACFGGSIDVSAVCVAPDACVYPKLTTSGSTALASIYKKVPIYLGNTRFGIGGTASAQLFKEVYNNIKNGETVGNAVLKMKRNKLSNAYSEFWKAIIYEIQLYGDPTLKLTGV